MITVIQSAEAEGRRMGRRSVKHPLQLDLIPVRPAGGREAQGLVQMAGGRVFRADGQPDEVGMTFQELAIYLNYNGPSGAEKAYKTALRKLKRDLYGGAYGRWLSAQKAIRTAKAEAEQDAGHHATPQRTWWEEKALANRFACEVAALIHVHEIFSDALETETE